MNGIQHKWTVQGSQVNVETTSHWSVDGNPVHSIGQGKEPVPRDWGYALHAWQVATVESFKELNSEVQDLRRRVAALENR